MEIRSCLLQVCQRPPSRSRAAAIWMDFEFVQGLSTHVMGFTSESLFLHYYSGDCEDGIEDLVNYNPILLGYLDPSGTCLEPL